MPAHLSLDVFRNDASVEQIDDAVRIPRLVGTVRNHHDGRTRFVEARQIMRLHYGSLSVYSVPDDQTIFRLKF